MTVSNRGNNNNKSRTMGAAVTTMTTTSPPFVRFPPFMLRPFESVPLIRRRVKILPRKDPLPKTGSLVDRALIISFWTILALYTFVILFDQWIVPNGWCPYQTDPDGNRNFVPKQYPNPDSKASDPCYYHRSMWLLGFNPLECDFSRRAISSILYGAAIGFERKAADRPAGIRTMSLVCLGACVFTMCGQFAFQSSTQTWDAARVSAAIPSGVGFLGSALIWKETSGTKGTENEKHQVHGLTTASSVWLSASVGIGAGGELYLYTTWCVILVVFVLRLGPRLVSLESDDSSYGNGDNTSSDWETSNLFGNSSGGVLSSDDRDDDRPITMIAADLVAQNEETKPILIRDDGSVVGDARQQLQLQQPILYEDVIGGADCFHDTNLHDISMEVCPEDIATNNECHRGPIGNDDDGDDDHEPRPLSRQEQLQLIRSAAAAAKATGTTLPLLVISHVDNIPQATTMTSRRESSTSSSRGAAAASYRSSASMSITTTGTTTLNNANLSQQQQQQPPRPESPSADFSGPAGTGAMVLPVEITTALQQQQQQQHHSLRKVARKKKSIPISFHT